MTDLRLHAALRCCAETRAELPASPGWRDACDRLARALIAEAVPAQATLPTVDLRTFWLLQYHEMCDQEGRG